MHLEKQLNIRKIHFASTWDLRHRIMWPDKTIDYVKLPNDKNGLHYGLFVNDKMTAIVSAFITKKEAQFRKFATLNNEQGKGHGTKLLSYLFLELTNIGITKIWCNARADKTSFYERFGMEQTKKRFDKGGISYVIMEKTL